MISYFLLVRSWGALSSTMALALSESCRFSTQTGEQAPSLLIQYLVDNPDH